MGTEIVVDLEWEPNSKISEPNVLQLGAVKINQDNEIIDSYYNLIKPEQSIVDMNLIVNLMPISEVQLMDGKNKNQVISDFINWCGKDVTFIIWGSTNYQVFKAFMNGNLEINKNNTIDLQTIYKMVKDEDFVISLSKACSKNMVKENYPLHHSLNDSITLAALYNKFSKYEIELIVKQLLDEKKERIRVKRLRYRRRRVAERIIKMPHHHFFIIEGTDIIHRRNCSCLNNSTTIIKGYSGLKGIMKGYENLCTECFSGHNSFPKYMSLSEAIHIIELQTICSDYGLSSESYGDTLIVNTNAGSWYFETGKKYPKLYHRNDIYPWKNKHGILEGYHKQKKEFINDFEIIKYICKHDKQLLKNYEKKVRRKDLM